MFFTRKHYTGQVYFHNNLVPEQQSYQVLESLCHCRSSSMKGQRTVRQGWTLHFSTRLVMFVTVMQCVLSLGMSKLYFYALILFNL